MSNQPPHAFGGQPIYGQQWHPSYTASIPTNNPPNLEPKIAPPPTATSHGQPLEYHPPGFNANAQVPSYGGQVPFLPMFFPYMGQIGASQMPYQTPPVDTRGEYQPVPESSNPPAVLNPPEKVFHEPPIPQRREDCASREEGEVSEGGRSFESKQETSAEHHLRRAPATRNSDLEEGETVSSRSQSSSRSSSRMHSS